jgi:hypothetical protein
MLFSSVRHGWFAQWVRRHPYTLVAAVLFIIAAIPFCFRHDSEWESVYVRAARLLCQGEDIYRPENGYLYPPFMTVLALPFSWLPWLPLRAAWFLVNVVAIIALVRCAWQVAGGPRLEGPEVPAKEHVAAVIGALCGIVYIQNCLAHQQTDLLIGALLMGGCLLLKQSRVFAAATCFGLAAAFKCTPLLWAPYLIWRRRAAAAAWVVVVALGLNFLPDVVHHGPAGRPWVATYEERFLAPLTSSQHYIGTWGSDPIYNQSLSGGVHRWFLTQLAWSDANCTIEPRTDLISPAILRALAYGGCLVLAGLTLFAAGRPGRLETLPGQHRVELECSAVLLLMLVLSPMSSLAHFAILILPAFCLARAAVSTRHCAAWIAPFLAALLALTASKDLLGERLYTVLLWGGSVTCQTLILLAGCLCILSSEGRRAPAAAAASLRHAA